MMVILYAGLVIDFGQHFLRDNIVSVINVEGLVIEGKDYVNEVSLKEFIG